MRLRRRSRTFCSWAALTMALAACGSAASPDRFKALAETIERERREMGVPGVAVAVVEGGEVTFARGFGTKAPSGGDPVTPSTLFRIGSVTKMLTAIAVLQQVEHGKVSLDAPIAQYIPGFHLSRDASGWAPNVTVRELLDDTSGIADYLEENAPPDERDDGALERFLTVRFTDLGYVQYPPGAPWSYSNPNFMLAGLVAEKTVGMAYRDLMRASVFTRLGMERTFFLPEEVIADGDYALGLGCSTEQFSTCSSPTTVTPDSYDNPWGRPAGYAWSNVFDLAKLAAFLVHGDDRVLASELRRAMLTSQVSTHACTDGDVVEYGFGIGVRQGFSLGGAYYRSKVIEHGGAISGFTAMVTCVPALDFCFITLANGDAGVFLRSRDTAFSTLARLPAPSAAPDVAPDPTLYSAYSGHYVDANGPLGEVQVSTVDGKLSVSVPSLDEAGVAYVSELTPTTLDNFTVQVNGLMLPLTFLTDESGAYRYLRCIDRYVAVRTP